MIFLVLSSMNRYNNSIEMKNEYEEPSVMLSDEEYHLLFHDHHTWVIYGRYKATEIRYLKANNQGCIVSICRYRATLLDGTELPISKEKYMGLKKEGMLMLAIEGLIAPPPIGLAFSYNTCYISIH